MKSCLTAAAALMIAVSASADVNDKVREMTPPKDSKEFATKAAESNLFEVKLAQLAQQKAQSDQVKQLAKQIEQDHQQANQQLMPIAQSKNITIPTELKGEKQEKLQAFQQLDGKTFESNYLLDMVKGHLHDIKMFTAESQSGTDPEIKQWATQILPHLKMHGQQVAQAASSQGIPVDALAAGAGRTGEAMPAGSRQPGSGVGRDTGTSDTGRSSTGGTSSGGDTSTGAGAGSGRGASGPGSTGTTSGGATGGAAGSGTGSTPDRK